MIIYLKSKMLINKSHIVSQIVSYILILGIWDLKIQLSSETKKKGIELKPWYFRFIDLKSEFIKAFPFFEYSPSLKMMLRCMLSFFLIHNLHHLMVQLSIMPKYFRKASLWT